MPAPTKPFLDTIKPAKWAKALIVGYFLNLVLLWATFFMAGTLYNSFPDLYWLIMSNASTLERGADIMALLITITCGICFALWSYRTHANFKNGHFGQAIYQENQSSLAGWGYFIPFINLYLPWKIVTENWDNFQLVITRINGGISQTNNLIMPWWVMFVASGIIERISNKLLNLHDPQAVLMMFLLIMGLRLAAGILAIIMINRFMRTEQEALTLTTSPSQSTVYNSLIIN